MNLHPLQAPSTRPQPEVRPQPIALAPPAPALESEPPPHPRAHAIRPDQRPGGPGPARGPGPHPTGPPADLDHPLPLDPLHTGTHAPGGERCIQTHPPHTEPKAPIRKITHRCVPAHRVHDAAKWPRFDRHTQPQQLGYARGHQPLATQLVPREAHPLEHHHPVPALRQLYRGRRAREPASHHQDIGVDHGMK